MMFMMSTRKRHLTGEQVRRSVYSSVKKMTVTVSVTAMPIRTASPGMVCSTALVVLVVYCSSVVASTNVRVDTAIAASEMIAYTCAGRLLHGFSRKSQRKDLNK